MQRRPRFRFTDEPINMLHPHRATACNCRPQLVTMTNLPAEDDYATLAQEARRRPITTAMINRLNRAFWRIR